MSAPLSDSWLSDEAQAQLLRETQMPETVTNLLDEQLPGEVRGMLEEAMPETSMPGESIPKEGKLDEPMSEASTKVPEEPMPEELKGLPEAPLLEEPLAEDFEKLLEAPLLEETTLMGRMRGWWELPLALPPSCIEFCPDHPEYILVGTYNLQEGGEDYGGTGNVPAGGQEDQQAGKASEDEDEDDNEDGAPARPEQSRNGSLVLVHNVNNTL